MPKIIKLVQSSYQPLLGALFVILFMPSLGLAQAGSFPSKDHAQEEGSKNQHNAHWDYLGVKDPMHWGLLSEEYVTCESGSKQSPVNIITKGKNRQQETLMFNYGTSEIHEMNNGHTIQVSHKSGCNINLDKNTYHLRQFHFHDPSEHHIDGKVYPMEMHLVHQDDSGHILVIAVMMEIGEEHPIMKRILDWLPNQQGKRSFGADNWKS